MHKIIATSICLLFLSGLLAACAAPTPETTPPAASKPAADTVRASTTRSAQTPVPAPQTPASAPQTPASAVNTPKAATPGTPAATTPAVPKPAAAAGKTGAADDRLADTPPGFESRKGSPGASDPGNPDRGCKTDSDCAVKDIGSCCGYFPACVNKNAKTDPAAVRAQCQKSGMSSICGFKEIKGCQCVQGRCEDGDGSSAI